MDDEIRASDAPGAPDSHSLPADTRSVPADTRSSPDVVVPATDAQPAGGPLMTKLGKLLFSDDFNAAAFGPGWAAGPDFELVNGAAVGHEIPADMHAASLVRKLMMRDVAVQFSFRFDGATQMMLGLRRTFNGMHEHLFDVKMTADTFEVRTRTVQVDGPRPRDQAKIAFGRGRWYTALIEIRGGEILAQVDGRVAGHAEGQTVVDVGKDEIALALRGVSGAFDDLSVWEALPDDTWTQRKASVLASKIP